MHPPSIIAFSRCFWLSIILTIVGLALDWRELFTPDGDETAISYAISTAIVVGVFGVWFALLFLLWRGITHRASQWARWIYSILSIAGVALDIALTEEASVNASLLIWIVAGAVSLVSVFFLFRKDAAIWFSRKPWLDPTTFD